MEDRVCRGHHATATEDDLDDNDDDDNNNYVNIADHAHLIYRICRYVLFQNYVRRPFQSINFSVKRLNSKMPTRRSIHSFSSRNDAFLMVP